jgi:hypothetical protein
LLEKREKEDRRAPAGAQGKGGAAKKPAVERRKGDRRKSSD